MLAVFLALKAFLPDLIGHHVLVRSDNMAVVSYKNYQGGLRSRPLYKLSRSLLLWAHRNLHSLNQGADMLSRDNVSPGKWTLHPDGYENIEYLRELSLPNIFLKEQGMAQPPLFMPFLQSCCSLR